MVCCFFLQSSYQDEIYSHLFFVLLVPPMNIGFQSVEIDFSQNGRFYD